VLTYKAIQTLAHDNHTVIIVATDVAANEAEKVITVSVKVLSLSTSVVWNGIGINSWKTRINCMHKGISSLKDNATNAY
jgi:hypothetical protein